MRNFRQEKRQDALHLKVYLHTSNCFIVDALEQSEKLAPWYIERILRLAVQPRHIRLANEHEIDLLQAVPISQIKSWASDSQSRGDKGKLLNNFLNLRWPEVKDKLTRD